MHNDVIKGFNTSIIKKENIYLLALSGGMDSMCLLYNMMKLKEKMEFKLCAIHINHGIRGKEALRDENFVKEYCTKHNIDIEIIKIDCIKYAKVNHKTLEEAGRILRYNEFDKYIKKLGKNAKLLVAHHKNDQVETVLHNMLRGSGIRGLSGIDIENGYIIRPMLSIDKTKIEKYVKDNKIPYVVDSTNDDENYTRNYIRKTVIKDIQKVNDKSIDHIYDLSCASKEVDNLLCDLSIYVYDNIFVSKDDKSIAIDVKKFGKERHIIKIYIIRHILDMLNIPKKDITKTHMEDIILLSSKEKGGHLDMPYNLTVDKKKQKLYFVVNNDNISMQKRKRK